MILLPAFRFNPLPAFGLLLLACGFSNLSAAVVVNTNFEHGASDIAGNTSPTFFNTTGWESGSGNVRYESATTATWNATGNSYVLLTGNSSAGGSMFARPTVTGGRRGMQLDLGTNLTGTFWLSALMRNEGTTTGSNTSSTLLAFENSTGCFSSADGQGFGINHNGNLVIAPSGGGGPGTSVVNGTLSIDTWYLFLAKITINGTVSGDDALDLWVFNSANSTFGQTEASLGAATYTTSAIQFGDSIGDIWWGAYTSAISQPGQGSLDNLRTSSLGTNTGLQEVLGVPEPGSAALLGLCALVVLRRRRR